MSVGEGWFIMHWPPAQRRIYLAIALFGFASWAIPKFIFGREVASPPSAFGLLITPIAIGLWIWRSHWVRVDGTNVDSHFLGFHRRLDSPSLFVLKTHSNGYTLQDGSGKRLFINNKMTAADSFARVLNAQQQHERINRLQR